MRRDARGGTGATGRAPGEVWGSEAASRPRSPWDNTEKYPPTPCAPARPHSPRRPPASGASRAGRGLAAAGRAGQQPTCFRGRGGGFPSRERRGGRERQADADKGQDLERPGDAVPSAPQTRAASGLLGSGASRAQEVAARDRAWPPGRNSTRGTRAPQPRGHFGPLQAGGAGHWEPGSLLCLRLSPQNPRGDLGTLAQSLAGTWPVSLVPPPLGFAAHSPFLSAPSEPGPSLGFDPGRSPPVRRLGRASLRSPGISRSLSGSSPLCLPRAPPAPRSRGHCSAAATRPMPGCSLSPTRGPRRLARPRPRPGRRKS